MSGATGAIGVATTAGPAGGVAVRPPALARVFSLHLLGYDPGDILARIVVGALFLALAISATSLPRSDLTGSRRMRRGIGPRNALSR